MSNRYNPFVKVINPSSLIIRAIQRILSLIKSLLLFLVSLVISGGLSACSGVPKNAQCIPIIYPTGEKSELKSYEVARYQVTDPFEDVIGFFYENLDPIPISQDSEDGNWEVEKVNENQVLFECVGRLGFDEAERGCILLTRKNEGQTTIESIWYHSVTETPICDRDLSIVR
jgi:hypothetical protein